ncbi:substrate-binding periplasmic protein [Arthrobacter yangruifuii]|uniref:substrate-binding periplasmic protein n=1 Tax=Arthrobacter yangruifuii TaxID=2606616 RepID=UPI0011B4148E|nr:ABC transporter substrate-binding protein [Arthrobacter yangruifuii]
MFSRTPKFPRRSALAAIGVVALTLTGCAENAGAASEDGLDTITAGKLTVAIQPYMPYTAMKDGQMVGLDAEILQAAAEKLDLTVEPQVTDFNGMLGGVQSGRVDVAIGGIAWTKERAEAGLFTDPPYYSPPAMAVHGNTDVKDLEDLHGKNLGTVTGYVWVKSIQAVPDAKLSSFPDANGLFADISAGRVDVGFVDPLLISYTQAQRPDLGLVTKYLTPPTAEEVQKSPDLSYFQPYMTSFYVSKEAPKLEKAISEAVREMYSNGEMATLIKKFGGDPDQYLKPSPNMAGDRQGTDRPADWEAPST